MAGHYKGKISMTLRYVVLIAAFFGALNAIAQDQRTLEYLQREEQRRKAELMRQLDSGVYLMDRGEYVRADKKFRYVLENIKSVPSDLTFYFGKNSFYLGNFSQAIDWLNKYIQLRGTSGQFYQEATTVLRDSEKLLLEQRSKSGNEAAEVLSRNYEIDCGPSNKVSCPVCKGDHVIIKKGAFGDEYRTCPYCNEHGYLSCDDYNKLLRGELQKKQ